MKLNQSSFPVLLFSLTGLVLSACNSPQSTSVAPTTTTTTTTTTAPAAVVSQAQTSACTNAGMFSAVGDCQAHFGSAKAYAISTLGKTYVCYGSATGAPSTTATTGNSNINQSVANTNYQTTTLNTGNLTATTGATTTAGTTGLSAYSDQATAGSGGLSAHATTR